MTANLRRALAVGLTATLVFLGLLTVPAHSAPPSAPSTCAGVWVVVQSDESTPSSARVGCATDYATGLASLQSAGFTAAGGAFLTQIDSLPTNTDWATNGNLWWSHWTAPVSPDGTLGAWTGVVVGADKNVSAPGTAEGWRLTVAGTAGPTRTTVITPAASSSASSTTSAPSTTAPSSAAASPSTAAAATAAAAPSSAVQSPAVLKAAAYLSANLPTTDDGAGAFISAILALSGAQSCAYSPALSALVTSLEQQAAAYVGTNAARAANLTIAAVAVGADPTSFGGLNLLSILAAGTHVDGQVGASASPFSQSLAVIAYVRAGQPVPPAVVANLVAGQNAGGAFGYASGGTFYPDYDATGVAIEALAAVHGDGAVIAKAVAWALAEQNAAGYWPNPYSPVDSTGILGSGLEFAGTSSGTAATWLTAQQLADGGFPASIVATTSNVTATADAMWLLSGTNLVTVSRVTCSATSTDPTVSIPTGSGAASLADTGGPDDGAVGALAVAMLVVGAGVLLLRRRQNRA